jgi:glycosyltransferase involved in cell wall biosynthesis
LGIKTIITNHSTNKDSVEIANEFDQVIVNNKEAYERSIELGMDRNKLSIIPLPARVLRDVSKEEIDKRMPNNPRIVTCGFAFKHKGIKELIYATQELLKSFPTLGLYLCCPEYPNWEESSQYLKECKELVDYLELHSSIFFIDKFLSMDELSPYLRGATVLAFPYSSSQNQDASGALRMAIAAERPIIVSTLGIFNELGDRVTRVEPENISDLIYALHSHLSNPQDRVRLDILDDIQASNISFYTGQGYIKPSMMFLFI